MRRIWVKIDPYDKDMVTTAIEEGADGIMVPPGYSVKVKTLGRIRTIAEDGDLKIGKDVIVFPIKSGADEDEIVRLSQHKKVILECSDWTIIPVENLIAKGADVILRVSTITEAETAFGILEKGINHILLHPAEVSELKKALTVLRSHEDTIPLSEAEITRIVPVGMGDRVCVDTCTLMGEGQGMLVGNSSSGLFLVHAESIFNPYVAPRPFRVNAGAVHAYIRVSGGKTRYLSELSAGDPVLIVDAQGKTTQSIVGRIKIEKRPLLLISAKLEGKRITSILQNAETIRLTTSNGKPVSVVNLQPGNTVLVRCEEGGRHFGHQIEESIIEN